MKLNVYCEQSELCSLFPFEQIKIDANDYHIGTILFRDGTKVEFELHAKGFIRSGKGIAQTGRHDPD